jgi:hypothetical protein
MKSSFRHRLDRVEHRKRVLQKPAPGSPTDLRGRMENGVLSDAELLERGNAALHAYEALKQRYGFDFALHLLSWGPRTLVKDPHKYWYPSHVLSEIRDIRDEMERRMARPTRCALS